jgi:putative ABC transport system permease protein
VFVKEGLIRIAAGDQNYDLFKEKIKENPDILAVSGALWVPPHRSKMNMSIPKVDEPDKMVTVNGDFADYHFAETMGLKILRGSDFDEKLHTSGVLVNESLIRVLGLKEVIGEETAFGTVVGVVSDFNMYSIHEVIPPMIIGLNPSMHREMAIRIRTENLQNTLDYLRKTWKSTGATTPFGFEFTDDILKNMYASDIRFSKIIGMMAFVAILIASLGLFGLSLLISRQKTKEIGIRKVNGAKISEVMTLLNKDFVVCVGIAFAAATPIAWWTMHTWLESFAYRTSLSWWIFALSGALALGIALLTVSWQSWKAAVRNPVEALRYE